MKITKIQSYAFKMTGNTISELFFLQILCDTRLKFYGQKPSPMKILLF